MGVLQPGMFDVCCLTRYAQASAKLRCPADIREPGAMREGQ